MTEFCRDRQGKDKWDRHDPDDERAVLTDQRVGSGAG